MSLSLIRYVLTIHEHLRHLQPRPPLASTHPLHHVLLRFAWLLLVWNLRSLCNWMSAGEETLLIDLIGPLCGLEILVLGETHIRLFPRHRILVAKATFPSSTKLLNTTFFRRHCSCDRWRSTDTLLEGLVSLGFQAFGFSCASSRRIP